MIFSYKLNLKRNGRYKKPYYNIIVVNKNNKLVAKVGGYNPIIVKKIKQIKINIFLLYCWLLKGLKISFFLSKILKIIFCLKKC